MKALGLRPRSFNSLLGVSSGDETLRLMFDILHQTILNFLLPALRSKVRKTPKQPTNQDYFQRLLIRAVVRWYMALSIKKK